MHFLAISEGRNKVSKRKLRIAGWLSYLLGVPAWTYILIGEQDWIAASMEVGAIPAMLLGLINAYQNNKTSSKLFSTLVSISTYTFLTMGVFYSIYVYGGLFSLTQLLEIGLIIRHLMGTLLLSRGDPKGGLYFMLTNISMCSLMIVHNKPLLIIQQLFSLGFAVYGYRHAKKIKKVTKELNL